ncbi:MAG: T9SS type A sorting domain-containing protein [Bacteroidia bacterium]
MKKLFILITVFLNPFFLKSQTTALDFTVMACDNTGPHHLFSDLDNGKVAIIEYFMTNCSPCISAGQTLEAMKSNLIAQFPGKIKSYAFGFTNSYSCSTILSWCSTNSITSIPVDSGAYQVAYYGGMGMPTIVIAAGSNHQILGSPYVGFFTSDTTQMATNIRNFFNAQVGVKENKNNIIKLNIYPNPSNGNFILNIELPEKSVITGSVLDITGNKVKQLKFDNTDGKIINQKLDLSDLKKGLYLISISTDFGKKEEKISIN